MMRIMMRARMMMMVKGVSLEHEEVKGKGYSKEKVSKSREG